MTAAITGGISLASGLFGMIGGLRGAKSQASPGIAPLFYMLSGQEEQAAAQAEAESVRRQSALVYEQSLTDAAQKEREYKSFREEQALKFASSGITLAGSPLGVLEETRSLGQQEVDAIRRRGEELSSLLRFQGLQLLRRGSAAAFGGFAQSLQSRFDAQNRQATIKSQAFQTGVSGLQAFVQAIGSMSGGGGGGGRGGGGYSGAAPGYGASVGGPTPITTIHPAI